MITVLFFGTPLFSVPTLRALCSVPFIRVAAVITQPDKPMGRGGSVTAPPIKEYAVQQNIPVFQPRSLKRELLTLREELNAFGPFDLGVVVAFGQILPPEMLSLPKRGCVNIHASLLPRWRGAAPIQRALEAGDVETGVCLMRMDEGLDTGDVFSMTRLAITESDNYSTLHDKLAQSGADLLMRDIQSIATGSRVAVPQPADGVSYANKITPQEMHIDWNHSAVQIARKIRAFAPLPGCYTILEGKRLKILDAVPSPIADSHQAFYPPGTVIQSLPDTVSVQCGNGSLRLLEVQLEGKRKMPIETFVRGSSLAPGSQLG